MENKKIKAGVVGATGYAGAELCRILCGHPGAELTAISSVSFEGQKLSDVYPAYFKMCDLVCETQEAVVERCDVIFAALPLKTEETVSVMQLTACRNFSGSRSAESG